MGEMLSETGRYHSRLLSFVGSRLSPATLLCASEHLNKSIKLDERFKEASVEDDDLAGLWDWFGGETASN